MLTIELFISIIGLCATFFGLGYALGIQNGSKAQK